MYIYNIYIAFKHISYCINSRAQEKWLCQFPIVEASLKGERKKFLRNC